MEIEAKARRIRALAEAMARLLSDGPKVCGLGVRLVDGMVVEVNAQMAGSARDGELADLGPVETDEPSESLGIWWLKRSVKVGGVTFWDMDAAPAPDPARI